ncbi:MAG: LexA repressor [Candidatus Daviesbacteria bacterium GW2011_GWB1_39_5]|uniref:LexA repressor n=1 Tax=Candidatus Daviesbacteria bacterium GW2011_GWC2_40_12 TaxID=1618431 RepID=A0A0G0TWG4_9BACT|nr:MAG: LexA repressor [Candidatus Daviesbacteria bacterium GW2011_GWB1_39_5]KKR42307.1 MAG: LexA repressor [Candidatus Daviesbacteria bacterium GW2011_GWC2_40_12]OGE22045.1 MAG: repressor LexA [Candidatus Daviesbacteria bacterium RIFCSPHIGHO2_01_FULL_40_24]OGE28710.1 MAG: repressor LexA [Candidatus Daviesbacteria bacterium RIFCSPHIGHO2_02_FULL_40_16]OGE42943.1 MAG: repressor LexA [Candidatus Daviesbacteria bacterium RIFCSPLOWO2_01_FULL_39_23]OGE66405.1 MAG: repressor LexA [Candidatus Daviesba
MPVKVKPITGRQKEALDFINSFIQDNGYAPSLRELAAFLKTDNISTAHYFVKELEKKGYLKRDYYKNRGITPILQKQTVPLLGYIAAGAPIEPIEDSEPIQVPTNIKLATNQSYYALKVKGDSMIDMGILDKDIVLIKHQMTADVGDVVVGITEDGATLKILGRKNGKTILEPRNINYKSIIPRQLEVRGVFVGLIRAE